MREIARQLGYMRQAWLSLCNIPEDLSFMGLPGRSKQSIAAAMDDLALMAAGLAMAPQAGLEMTRRSCEASLQLLEDYICKHLSEQPALHLLGFLTILQQLHTTLTEAMTRTAQEDGGQLSAPSQAA